MPVWLGQLLIAVALQIVALLLTPRPGGSSKQFAEEIESPKTDTGSPIPVVYGRARIKSPNVLWYGNKYRVTRKVKA